MAFPIMDKLTNIIKQLCNKWMTCGWRNLDEKLFNKWQYVQHYKSIMPVFSYKECQLMLGVHLVIK